MHYLYTLSLIIIKFADLSIYLSNQNSLQAKIKLWNEMKSKKIYTSNRMWIMCRCWKEWLDSKQNSHIRKKVRWSNSRWRRTFIIMQLSNAYVANIDYIIAQCYEAEIMKKRSEKKMKEQMIISATAIETEFDQTSIEEVFYVLYWMWESILIWTFIEWEA